MCAQGDIAPNTKLSTIAAAVASGVNMNELVHESIECSRAGTEPYTDAQFESVAQLVAAASKALGIPINRITVVVHADINSVSRRSDPWPPATREARVKRDITRANAILRPPIVTVTVKSGWPAQLPRDISDPTPGPDGRVYLVEQTYVEDPGGGARLGPARIIVLAPDGRPSAEWSV